MPTAVHSLSQIKPSHRKKTIFFFQKEQGVFMRDRQGRVTSLGTFRLPSFSPPCLCSKKKNVRREVNLDAGFETLRHTEHVAGDVLWRGVRHHCNTIKQKKGFNARRRGKGGEKKREGKRLD